MWYSRVGQWLEINSQLMAKVRDFSVSLEYPTLFRQFLDATNLLIFRCRQAVEA